MDGTDAGGTGIERRVRRRGGKGAVALVGALTLALASPSAFTGFCTDDHAFRALLRRGRSALDLFRFAPGDAASNRELVAHGVLPWWSAADLKIHFLRPLTGVFDALDLRLFGDAPFGYHADSIAWYLALVVLVGLLLGRLLEPVSASLAALAFAWAGCHASAYAWVSARHVLIGAVPVVGALVLHVRARERHRSWVALCGAAAVLAVGLAGSEAAVAGAAYFVAYEALGRRDEPWQGRAKAIAPVLCVLAVYVVVYRVLGCGARASGGYHDPTAHPFVVATLAIARAPALLADALVGLPSEGANLGPRALGFLALGGTVAAALFAWLLAAVWRLLEDRERRALTWLVPGALATLLIVAGTGIPGGRLLVVPDIGLAPVVGVVLRVGLSRARRPWALRAACAAVAGLHVVLAPLLALREMRALARRGRAAEAMAQDVDEGAGAARAAFVVASDPLALVYAKAVRADESDRRLCWSALAGARTEYRFTRTGERSFALEASRGPVVGGFFERLFRSPEEPLAVGDEVAQCGATIRVAAAVDGMPTRVEVETRHALDGTAVFVWKEGHLRRLALPAVGEGLDVAWEPGPSEARWR